MTLRILNISSSEMDRFTKNLMPELRAEYLECQLRIPFDLEKIRRKKEGGGFGVDKWDDIYLQELLYHEVNEGLI